MLHLAHSPSLLARTFSTAPMLSMRFGGARKAAASYQISAPTKISALPGPATLDQLNSYHTYPRSTTIKSQLTPTTAAMNSVAKNRNGVAFPTDYSFAFASVRNYTKSSAVNGCHSHHCDDDHHHDHGYKHHWRNNKHWHKKRWNKHRHGKYRFGGTSLFGLLFMFGVAYFLLDLIGHSTVESPMKMLLLVFAAMLLAKPLGFLLSVYALIWLLSTAFESPDNTLMIQANTWLNKGVDFIEDRFHHVVHGSALAVNDDEGPQPTIRIANPNRSKIKKSESSADKFSDDGDDDVEE